MVASIQSLDSTTYRDSESKLGGYSNSVVERSVLIEDK